MVRERKLKNIILYYLLKSIKELGISLPLLFRRITETASKDIRYLSNEFFGGKMHIGNFEELAKDLGQMLKQEELVKDLSINFREGEVIVEVNDCSYLDIAAKAKSENEPGCPICLISLLASIASTVAKGYNFNLSEYESDIDNKKCKLTISYTHA